MIKCKLRALVALITLVFAGNAAAQMTSIQRQELLDQNVLAEQNPGFENGKARWTNSGSGTFTTTSTSANLAYGTRSGSWDASTSGDYLQLSAAFPSGLIGLYCEADFTYKGGDSSITVEVLDGSSVVLTSRVLSTASAFTPVRLPFTCPLSGSTIALKFRATGNAAVVYLDQAFLGLTRQNPDVSPVVHSFTKQAVGSIGSALQIVAGHTLAAEDFPVTTGKIAFWNGTSVSDGSSALSCTSGTAACTLTNSGTTTFAATGYAGASNAISLNGTTQSLSSTDAFFKPGASDSYAVGGWFLLTDWTPSATNYLAAWEYDSSGTNRGMAIGVSTTGLITVQDTATGADATMVGTSGSPSGFTDGTWHHVATVYDKSRTTLKLYLDGRFYNSVTLDRTAAPANHVFRIGARGNTAASFMAGRAQDVFFHKNTTALTDDDIRKLYAFKLSHNKGVPTTEQQWVGTYSRSDDKLDQQMMSDWIVAQDANSVWWDLSGLASTSRFSAKLMQNGFTSTIVPASTYSTGELTAAPTVPITHGLGGRPQWVLVEQEGQVESTSWSPLDGVCWAKGDTQINCDFSGLTIDSTHRIRITGSMTPGASAVRPATSTAAGLFTAGQAPGTATNDDACSTCVGYYIENRNAVLLSQSSPVSGTWYDTGVTLAIPSAGDWDVHWGCNTQLSMTGTGYARAEAALRDGSTTLDSSTGSHLISAGDDLGQAGGYYRYKASAAATLKLSFRAVTGSGSPTLSSIYCRGDLSGPTFISARRAR